MSSTLEERINLHDYGRIGTSLDESPTGLLSSSWASSTSSTPTSSGSASLLAFCSSSPSSLSLRRSDCDNNNNRVVVLADDADHHRCQSRRARRDGHDRHTAIAATDQRDATVSHSYRGNRLCSDK